jgi:hypothetical protein
VGSARAAAVPPSNATRLADSLFERMVDGHEAFWSLVYPLFTTRDMTRADLRQIVTKGLQQTRSNYKVLAELFNMPKPGDNRRFLNFLRRHRCEVPFQRFCTVTGQPADDDPIDRRDAPELNRLMNVGVDGA